MEDIEANAGGSVLVFGAAAGAAFWEQVNPGGITAVVGFDAPPSADAADAPLEWSDLLERPDLLILDLPSDVRNREWDIIVTDRSPATARQRLSGIFEAGRLAAVGSIVFVADCDDPIVAAAAARHLGDHRVVVTVRGERLLNGYAF